MSRSGAATGRADRPSASWVGDLVTVLPAWVVARVLVVVAWVVAKLVVDRFGLDVAAFDDGLLGWDGTWYRDIAEHGYQGIDDEGVRFFPLYPLLGGLLGGPIGATGAALVVLANVCTLAVGVLVVRLMRIEGRSEAAGRRAVWLVMLFPAAFVLVWGYAESLMLAAALVAFIGLRRQWWLLAAAAGLVAALTRPVGLVLVLPALVEGVRCWRGARGTDRAGIGLAVLAPALGTALYLGWVRAAYGDALLPFRIQEDLRGEPVNPLVRMWDGVTELFGPERFGQGLHLPFAVVMVALLVLTFRRWPVSYGLYAAGVLVLALGADNLNSLERYGLNAFPLLLTLALLVTDERVERATLALFGGGFVALCSLAWLASYVP